MNESKPDINKVLFMHLVSMLAMSAIQQMGKLVDPNTGKAEKNLEAAQATIDMLDMLEAMTRGNLDAEETRMLKDTLMSLKMNYVQSQGEKSEVRSQKSEVRDQKSEDAGGPEKQTPNIERPTPNAECQKTDPASPRGYAGASNGMPEPKSDKEPPKDPKFHKNYS
ncbi:MAG: DUF1844 domain-containing protein [Verrucomicrobia bacterium]|nr:DUF1844 domain-containing protein [Verrucomicrobiota bacterium]